ncbi:MAG: imidazole glycerol phosphate synthase subunit HisH [Rhodocyclaceae bacterium]|nr:MAG: imidazole glycerol phosphate synthase subunit HisH [Rhodocyclaceae bacterium]
MKKRVTLIDYGIGNLLSVSRAFEACGAEVLQTENPADIAAADYLVLPGVGAFVDGMRELNSRGLVEPIRAACASGKPVLGICLGMQMLFTESDEHHLTPGLGVIAGRVEAIPNDAGNGHWRKTPHIGWSELITPSGINWQGTIFTDLIERPAAYFVHSFSCVPASPTAKLAECEYEGIRICAAVRQGNVYGCQFHPEKSGLIGLHIIRNFILL